MIVHEYHLAVRIIVNHGFIFIFVSDPLSNEEHRTYSVIIVFDSNQMYFLICVYFATVYL